MFGNNKPTSVFGQAATPARSTTTADSGFGRIDALFSNAGQPQQSGSSAASNLFGAQGFARNTPVFGGAANTNAPVTGNLFGGSATAGSGESNIFGSGGGSFKHDSGFGSSTFGAGSSTDTSSNTNSNITQPPVFGGGTQRVFGGFSGGAAGGSAKVENINLFGKGTNVSGTIFGKPPAPVTSRKDARQTPQSNPFKLSGDDTKVLFSKKDEGTKPVVNPFGMMPSFKPVFGQKTSEPSTTGSLFGKPAEPKQPGSPKKEQGLFGKDVKIEKSTAELFGKKSDTSSGPFGSKPSPIGFPKVEKGAPKKAGLFGKPITSERGISGPRTEKPGADSQVQQRPRSRLEGRQGPRKVGGLFGKAVSDATASQVRQPVQKRAQPEDRADTRDPMKERKIRIKLDTGPGEKPPREKPKVIVKSSNLSSEPVALVAKNIPASCNNKATLSRHFSKFGEVTKIFSNPSKASAVIHFASHEDALQAKRMGRKIKENLPAMQFFWSSFTPSKSVKDDNDDNPEDGAQQPSVKATLRRSLESRMKSKKPSSYDSNVNDELSSLRGTEDITADTTTILQRPGRTGTPEPTSSRSAGAVDRTRARSVSPVRSNRGMPEPTSPSRKGTPPPGRSAGAVVSLKSLGDTTAYTANDFYTILDNRDKLIRAAMDIKNRDWAHAAATKGTCPDMCPEKERYMREDRHQLSVYETVPGTERVDHHRAVKEYSRSSADQEMPLPHELRPAEVLDKTMTYLLNNIVDQGKDGMWADWYDFLWNRTRAIRKDITQQHLCNLTTVGLIEKCVRFHIYAAHRLCEEPMNCFDMKINNENLTKCLQTLKELYHDLKVKHNTICPKEAEFRAYMVLMNLNEGDVLREAQQLPPEIRQSPEMAFALKAHAAVNENNYVKFFKLAWQSSFLQGCIIHRYFNQIRKKAIMILLRAYRAASSTAYPLERIGWLLKFESVAEAQNYFEHHGLEVREGCVILEKGAYVDPEAVFAPTRAVQLIESKLTTSVGEVINGEPLGPNIIPEPTTSFNSAGRFMVSSVPLPKEELQSETPVTTSSVDRAAEVVAPPTDLPVVRAADLPFSNELVKELTRELFIEVISEMCQEIGTQVVQDQHITTVAVQVLNISVALVTQEMTKEIVSTTVDELEREKREAEARKRAELAAERQASKDRASGDLINDIMESTVASLFKEIAQEECRLVEKQLREESEARISKVVCDELVKQEVDMVLMDTVRDFHQEHVVRRLEQLKQAEEAVRLAFVGRFFHLWKNETAGRQRLKRVFLTFPAAPNMDPLPQQVQELIPESRGVVGNMVNLGGSSSLTIEAPSQVLKDRGCIRRSCSAHSLYFKLRHRVAWSPINVGSVILNQMRQGLVPSCQRDGSCYWKGILSLPDEMSVPVDLPKWLRTKFTKGSVPTDIPSDNRSELLSLYSVRNNINNTNVCVRCINGDLSTSDLINYHERQDFNAVTAVIHLMFCPPELSTSFQYWKREKLRLERVIAVMPKERIPVMVLFCHDQRDGLRVPDIEMKLSLQIMDRENMQIKELELDVDDPVNQNQLQEGLEWLIRRSPAPPKLTCIPVTDVVENMVTLEFSQPVYQDLAARRKLGYLDQPLEILVAFYNDVIEYLAETVTSTGLLDFSWPPPEFASRHTDILPPSTWNDITTLEESKNLILSVRLPEPDLIRVETWEDGCNLLWSFLSAVVEESTQSSHVELYSRVRWLLRRAHKEMTDLCDVLWVDFDSETPNKCLSANLPWTEIVMACVQHKLLEFKFNPGVTQQNDLPKVVVYESNKLGQYHPPELWSSAAQSGVLNEDEILEMSVLKSLKRKLEQMDDSPKKSPKVTNVTILDISPLRPVELEANRTMYELETSVAAGKEESKALDDLLKAALQPENKSTDSYSNSFIQSQLPMYAVSPLEFQDFICDVTPTVHTPDINTEYSRKSLGDELNDFRANMASYKREQMLESLRLERMLMEH